MVILVAKKLDLDLKEAREREFEKFQKKQANSAKFENSFQIVTLGKCGIELFWPKKQPSRKYGNRSQKLSKDFNTYLEYKWVLLVLAGANEAFIKQDKRLWAKTERVKYVQSVLFFSRRFTLEKSDYGHILSSVFFRYTWSVQNSSTKTSSFWQSPLWPSIYYIWSQRVAFWHFLVLWDIILFPAVLFSIPYHTLFKRFLALCVIFRTFRLVKGYPPAFIVDFGLRKCSFASWKFLFWHYKTFFRTNRFFFKNGFYYSSWEKCGFQVLCVSFGVFLALRNW